MVSLESAFAEERLETIMDRAVKNGPAANCGAQVTVPCLNE